MKENKKRNISLAILFVTFNFFFWKEALGINLVIFIFLLSMALIFLRPEGLKKSISIFVIIPCVYSAFFVIWVNSVFSIFALILSTLLLTGFAHQKGLSTLPGSFFTSFSSFTLFPYNLIEDLKAARNKYKPFAYFLKMSKLVVLPVIIFSMFYTIYAYSNPIFNSYSASFWSTVRDSLRVILDYYPPERFAYLLFGLFLIMGILYRRNISIFLKGEHLFTDFLLRDKYSKLYYGSLNIKKSIIRFLPNLFKFKMHSLISEYRIGLILIFLVNALILVLNIIDIKFIWFGFDVHQVENLAYFVHEGTYYLIFSIILSMAILLYFFRGNLNFYSRNKLLEFGAYLWIFQNGILAVSVALRNYYYINHYYALSYKRIGVMIFLVLTFAGLISMIVKIKYKKTLFYLIKINTWILFITILIASSFNWDYNIASFNLKNPDKFAIDYGYLFHLSDDVLPQLYTYKEYLNKDVIVYEEWNKFYLINGISLLDGRISNYLKNYDEHSWLSWNFADYQTYKLLRLNL